MIAGICGNLGSGKTSAMTYAGLAFYQQGYKLFSNYDISLPQEDGTKQPLSKRVETYQDFNRIHSGYFLADELWSWIDARMSMTDANMFLSDILLKSRKRGFNLLYTAQHFSQVEKRVRNITGYIIYPTIEIHDPLTGEIITLNQSFLHPIDMTPYLPFTVVHAFVTVPDQFTGIFDKVVSEYEFPLLPLSRCYDTTEEVKDLLAGELERGMEAEEIFKNLLKVEYPDAVCLRVPDSGRGQNTFDVEMKREGILSIYDPTALDKGKYLALYRKKLNKYREVEESRECITYFSFEYLGNWYSVPSQTVIGMHTKNINVERIITLPNCHKHVDAAV